jgi:hypothetical protein
MMRKKNKIYDTVITVIIGQSKTPIYEKVTKNYNLKEAVNKLSYLFDGSSKQIILPV